MAPRETVKATPKLQQRTVSKTKSKASPIATIKKTKVTRKLEDATPLKANNAVSKGKTAVPSTPKTPKAAKDTVPSSTTKSGRKIRKLKNAHSGVPVPTKMLKFLGKQLAGAAK